MKFKLITIILVFTLILAGCSSGTIPASGQSWRLTSLTVDGTPVDLTTAKPITLEIGDDTNVGGSSGCNAFFGNLEFKSDGTLVPGVFGGTEMACDTGMEVESAYLKALSQVDTYKYSDSELTLSGNNGQTVLVFQLSEGTY